jgi:D-arabinose 1-dehydrogenase-like Zn-dependent alcohol dehydrogenase
MTSSLKTSAQTVRGKAAQVNEANKGLESVTLDFAAPDPDHVRVKIEACGVCHSDSFSVGGQFPGLSLPIVPGHEIVGKVEAVGQSVTRLKVGDRVGIGWHGGHCYECPSCLRGDFICCLKLATPGISYNGGYAEYGNFPEAACALVPEGLTSAEAAPLLCAGVTTYNALRHSGARAGDLVAILGIGGLGHLAVQYANKMGFKTVAIARGTDKAEFATKLGAHQYIDSEAKDAVQKLQKMGGAKVILSTVTSAKAMSPWVDGLATDVTLLLVGASMEPMEVTPVSLIMARRSVKGWPSGTAMDSQDCLEFSALTGIRPMIEKFSLDNASQAYERMISGKARFRAVLTVD